MQTREALNDIDIEKLRETVKNLWIELAKIKEYENHIKHISITKDAFPDETEILLNKFLSYCLKIKDKKMQTVLRFAAFAVLE